MHADSFHRLLKTLVDSGEAATVGEAEETFAGYGVRVVLDPSVTSSAAEQMIALTVVNTAARSFRGNVHIDSASGIGLDVPGFEGQELVEFSRWAGVARGCKAVPSWPVIHIGGKPQNPLKGVVRPWARGWTFGLGGAVPAGSQLFPPACVAAGALAVSEAFSLLRGDSPYAGRRSLRFSLWSMADDAAVAPEVTAAFLDDGVWLVGLGHLGQAYCWTLGLMPAKRPLTFILQDVDIVTESTLSTSVLSGAGDVGRKKTRVVAAWLEARGFDVRIVERRFDAATRVSPGEPTTALFGVDNTSARRCCEQAGFSLVLDAGLGAGYRDFRGIRVRAFPGASTAAKLWADGPAHPQPAVAPAYRALLEGGHDPCGVTTLATRSVGAPFVGCFAAALVIAELVRRRLTGRGNDVIDIDLRNATTTEKA